MSREYFNLFRVGDVDCLAHGNIEETDAVIRYLKDTSNIVIPRISHQLESPVIGVFVELADAYKTGYYLKVLLTASIQGQYITGEVVLDFIKEVPIPIQGDESGVTILISDVPFEQLVDEESINSAFIRAFGVNFTLNDVIPLDPEDERTFIRIRDNETFKELGKAYDLMNTRIYEEINSKFTLDFNILPYYNVYRIMHPNFVELNGNYFRIRRIEKNRTNSLMMAISCEHISYELNNPYELDAANEEIELPDDYPYEGTPREILEEMLQGTRFSIGAVHFNQSVQFTSKPMGTRSMIIGLANEIGAEVIWDKFTISLVARRGADRNLSFEVGKNLLSMTEVYEIHANGAYNRFYDVDVIDLSRIKDENVQQELYDIQLGDTVTLTDEQFNINISQRIVSHEIDPFRKELPKIQLEHVRKNIANTIGDISSSVSDLKRLKGGGGNTGGEVVINLMSDNPVTVLPSETDEVDPYWVSLGLPDYRQFVRANSDTDLTAGLKLMGYASAPATLEGIVQMHINGKDIDFPNSKFKTSLTTGYNTIGIPFAPPTIKAGTDLNINVKLVLSHGSFNVIREETTMYLKGKNIEVLTGQIST